jgi:DNA-binding response OmpR family regulator
MFQDVFWKPRDGVSIVAGVPINTEPWQGSLSVTDFAITSRNWLISEDGRVRSERVDPSNNAAKKRRRSHMDATPRVLVVDDEFEVREMLDEYLTSHGFAVVTAADAADARSRLKAALFDLALLDVTMPGEDGLSLARHVREAYSCGIIMLTASASVVDRIVGLEIGADDYVAKPFDPRELLARIRSVLRRLMGAGADDKKVAAVTPGRQVPFGRCVLDLDGHRLTTDDGSDVALTAMEFDLLKAFAERPNRVLTRDQLLDLAHNREWDPFDRSIDIRIARLRRKIEVDPAKPEAIKTVRGSGYMFIPQSRRTD